MRGRGLADVSARALRHELNNDPAMLAAEMGWLDDRQLDRLILAAHHIADAAAEELRGREANR